MSETLSQLIRSTKEYSDVCDTCKDEILIYPTISGRTEYSQDEVEQITLKRIKELLHDCNSCKFHQYKQAPDEIEKFIKSDVCGPCKESKEDPLEECNHSREECNYKIILDTVNKAKEK